MTVDKSNPKQGAEEYFSSVAEEPAKHEAKDISSEEEQNVLFLDDNGKQDINKFIRHEEFLLKKLNSESERNLRERNAKLAFRFSSIWAIFIGTIILLKGFGEKCGFEMSQAEFLFIIGSLTASIFTFYSLVLRYLFYRPNSTENK